jgi:PAS domain S-box-containing protein
MKDHMTKILLVEDNPGDARLIREMLAAAEGVSFKIDWVTKLSEALDHLAQGGIDLVLLDLALPDSRGIHTFLKAHAAAPQIPFVVLTGFDDETVALTAIKEGAQDYLVKGQADGDILLRAIRYATERKRIEEDLRRANEKLQREIEERRAAEMAVEAERQRLYALLDGLPGFIHLKAPDYSIRYANRVFQETFGVEDWYGKPCYQILRNRDEPCETCQARKVFETGEANEFEWTYPELQQTYQISNYPFADIDGTPLVLTMGIDITARKQAEEAQRQSEIRLAKAQQIAHLGSWEWDVEKDETTYSDEMYRIFGLPKGERGLTSLGFFQHLHPEDREKAKATLAQSLAHKKPYSMVYRIVRPGGAVRYVYSQAEAAFAESGRPLRMVGTAQDITERRTAEMRLRESEERFRAIFEAAAMGIILTDMDGRLLSSNKTFQEMLGYKAEELRGKNFIELTHADDAERNLEVFRGLQSRRVDQYQIKKRYYHKDGQTVWARVTVSLMKDSQDRPLYAIGMVEDITQVVKVEEHLQESEERLRILASQLMTAQEDERRRIARELHDELGQSLLVLKLQARSIQNDLLPEQEQLVSECQEMRSHLDRVVENVRRLSRDLSPQILEDLGLAAALRRLLEDFSRHYDTIYQLQEADIDGLFSLGIQTSIYRIFQECLTNIGKHSQANLIMVSINKSEGQVNFLIQDNGKGFDPEVQRRQGGGMGLAAMRERARMVGGALTVWSREGEGTNISINIPFAAPPD